MKTKQSLIERLEEVSRKIDTAEHKLKARSDWTHGNVLTQKELLARYAVIKRRLNREIADLEASGHHVTALEASLREWWLAANISMR
ncbi:3-ketoacyl-ACP reductase [Limimaricola sp.]|uniref:3-ketoacyl-ACP reductase n=1 Tax=Limimaricola sp. TaxID=2211665 RepID=UPI0040585BD0